MVSQAGVIENTLTVSEREIATSFSLFFVDFFIVFADGSQKMFYHKQLRIL